MPEPAIIHRVSRLDLPCGGDGWQFATARRAEIDAHFDAARAAKPQLWNGRVLLGRHPRFDDGTFSAEYFETDFASFMSWRDWGFPDASVFNGFGMGVLRAADGALVLAEMGAHTANAGKVYFPGGTPDPDDIRDGRLDIEASIVREIEEETGLTPSDYRAADHCHCVVTGTLIAVLRVLEVDVPGELLRDRIEANLAQQATPELAGIRLVRSRADYTATMPRFVKAYIDHQLEL
jgi:8-oxo-dGTP pyrophosphatase MutT (NUDIX family)